MENAPVFVIGCPRSGNTLLGAILNKHPDAFILFEANTIANVYRLWHSQVQNPQNYNEAQNHLHAILCISYENYHKQFHISSDDIKNCFTAGESHWGKLFDQYIQLYLSRVKPSAKFWGDKTPHHIGHIKHILNVYPEARFIYTYRDPRNVVYSLSKTSFSPASENKLQNAAIVTRYLSIYERNRKHIPKNQLLEIRYEDLVEEPSEVVKTMCNFLAIDYSSDLLKPADQKTRNIIGWPNDKAWGSISPQKGINSTPIRPDIDAYLHYWTQKQNYTLGKNAERHIWRFYSAIATLPYKTIFALYNGYWRTKYPEFPLFLLRLPYIQ